MPDPRIWPIPSAVNGAIMVAVASTLVLAAAANRVDAELVNDGDNVIYLSRGIPAVMGSGIRLNPRGGSYRIGTANLYLGAIYGIAIANTNMTVTEGIKP